MNEMSQFDRELRSALQRTAAPAGLKQRILQARVAKEERSQQPRFHAWLRMAASLLLVAALGGGMAWRQHERQQEELRQGEEARRQLMIALRITSHALNHMNHQLAGQGRAIQN